MRLALAVALIAFAPALGSSSADRPVFMLGPICHDDAPPPIAGPHKLVMLDGMGNDRMAADTRSPEAQRWFDYGLTLARSFQHGDAVLAFQRAEAADPTCSLCVWGEAWAAGPTINFPAKPGDVPGLLTLAKKARALAAMDAPARVKGLEAALVDRYGASDAQTGDRAFAADIDRMNKADPTDVEMAIFDAEAWLVMENLHDDHAAPTRAVAALEPLMPTHADYSGLVHFYVHATEEAGVPERAAPYAAKLAELAPMASHMVHMPSHTWFRIGRYEDAAQANLAALRADRAYAEKTAIPTPLGAVVYHSHDIQFGLGGAMTAGDAPAALELVRQFNRDYPGAAAEAGGKYAAAATWMAFGRFEDPEKVLAAPDTVAADPILEALRHYARGEADLRLGRAADVRAEAALVTAPSAAANSDRAVVIEIARRTLLGEADLLDHRPDAAITEFAAAADLQDKRLAHSWDPPAWWYPVRRSLAAARLAKGDAAGAEHEADTVLKVWKLDPVTLAIRADAEKARHQPTAAADALEARRLWHGGARSLQAAAGAAAVRG
jgi:tetratricopeptide (TPR) repeat protein